MTPDRFLPRAYSSIEAMHFACDLLPFGVLFLDDELRMQYINRYLVERLPPGAGSAGAPVESILGTHSDRTLQLFSQALEDRQPLTLSAKFHPAVFKLQAEPGSPLGEVPQSVFALPALDPLGATGLLVVVQDVTERALAEAELKREMGKLAFLHDLDLSLNTLDLDACLARLTRRLRDLFQVEFACVLIEKEGTLEIAAQDGLLLPPGPIAIDASSGLTGWVFQNRQSLRVGDVRTDPRYRLLFESIRSEMAAPLIARGRCIGVIDLESSRRNAFTLSDLKLLEMAAFSAANALHNAQVHAESEYWRLYYRGVVNQTGDIIYAVDQALRLTSANQAWDQFAQENQGERIASTEIRGKDLLAHFSGNEREKWRTLCAELLNGQRDVYREDIPCHAPDRERWLNLQAAPLRSEAGEISGIIFRTHDISEHVFAERRLRAINNKLETLLRISQLLNQNLPSLNVPQIAAQALAETLQADCVTITLFDESEQAFRVIASAGASERHIREFRSPRDQARQIIQQYGRTGTIYHLQESIHSINQPIYHADQLQGLLYSLIEHQGKTIGSLNIFTRDPERRFDVEEITLVQAISPQVGLAMENARLYAQLQNQATTDSLTGLANRRRLDDLINTELERSKRYGRRFSILMIDIDHFKCYNDAYGHEVGDDLIRRIGGMLKTSLRAGDAAARYGGDEFVVILPETDIQGAACIASRLLGDVGAIEVSQPRQAGCRPVTLSIGAAAYPDHAAETSALLRCADQALYQAKQAGRNRLEIYRPRQDP